MTSREESSVKEKEKKHHSSSSKESKKITSKDENGNSLLREKSNNKDDISGIESSQVKSKQATDLEIEKTEQEREKERKKEKKEKKEREKEKEKEKEKEFSEEKKERKKEKDKDKDEKDKYKDKDKDKEERKKEKKEKERKKAQEEKENETKVDNINVTDATSNQKFENLNESESENIGKKHHSKDKEKKKEKGKDKKKEKRDEKEKEKEKKKEGEGEEENPYADEGFEDYNDDFEEDDDEDKSNEKKNSIKLKSNENIAGLMTNEISKEKESNNDDGNDDNGTSSRHHHRHHRDRDNSSSHHSKKKNQTTNLDAAEKMMEAVESARKERKRKEKENVLGNITDDELRIAADSDGNASDNNNNNDNNYNRNSNNDNNNGDGNGLADESKSKSRKSNISQKEEKNSRFIKPKPRPSPEQMAKNAFRWKRASDIKKLIEFDEISFEIISQAPMSDYQLYIHNFGGSNKSQIAIQADGLTSNSFSIEAQTDEIEFQNATQQFPEDSFGWGALDANVDYRSVNAQYNNVSLSKFLSTAAKVITNLMNDEIILSQSNNSNNKKIQLPSGMKVTAPDVYYSSGFSRIAPRSLLNSNMNQDSYTISCISVFRNRNQRSDSDAKSVHLIAIAYNPSSLIKQQLQPSNEKKNEKDNNNDNEDEKKNYVDLQQLRQNFVYLWKTNNTTTPIAILHSESLITSLAFIIDDKNAIVIGGTVTGSVYIWDIKNDLKSLKFSNSNSNSKQIEGTTKTDLPQPIFASYTTDCWYEDNHKSSIVRISNVIGENTNEDEGKSNNENNTSNNNSNSSVKEFVTMDEEGEVGVWQIINVSLQGSDVNTILEAGSELDLGLAIHSPYKLTRSRTLSVNTNAAIDILTGKTRKSIDVSVDPYDPSRILVSTASGQISHLSRFGNNATPRYFQAMDQVDDDESATNDKNQINKEQKENLSSHLTSVSSSTSPSTSTSITNNQNRYSVKVEFSPFLPNIFISATADGCLEFYCLMYVKPILTLSNFTRKVLVWVSWSLTNPSMIFVLDNNRNLYLFDLLKNDRNAVYSMECKCEMTKSINILHVALTENNIVFSFADGSVEIHELREKLKLEDKSEFQQQKSAMIQFFQEQMIF